MNSWLLGGVGGGIVNNFGKVMNTLLYLKCITNKNLLYSKKKKINFTEV